MDLLRQKTMQIFFCSELPIIGSTEDDDSQRTGRKIMVRRK